MRAKHSRRLAVATSQRHHQGDNNQTSNPEHRHSLVLDDREQNKEGSDVLLQAQESQASTLTLSDDKSIDLGGLQPNTIAAIQHLQRRWRARGKDGTQSSLAKELRLRGSDRANVRTDNRDDHNKTRDDKYFAPSHNGRAGAQGKDVDEEDNVRPPASKRRKPNRHPSEVEPPTKPKSGQSLRRRLAYRRDNSAKVEDEKGDNTYQPPSNRRKGSSLARSTVCRPATRRHLHLDNAASFSQRVRTSASGRKRSD
ncbi:hypothetical protein NUW58_g538 [Xylaria curta]|uniref:Uncharacterized protein n=1 Tax=Xylaria curta TaxID=42375 RepID=A0ACC1PNU8_9PEZI|nr:hypothetical protein NUW58_g538 [Xylaria curta]